MQRRITLAIASALAISFFAVAPASAETGSSGARVNFQELNLDNEAGAETLLRRIRYAARQACGARNGPMDLDERAAIRRCVRDAIEQGVSDVNRAELSALHSRRARA